MSQARLVSAADGRTERAEHCRRLADAILSLQPPPARIRLREGAMLQVDSRDAWLYVLVRGRVRLGRLSPTGRRVELGELSGPACLLTASAAEEAVVGLQPCELLPLRRDALAGLSRADPSLIDLLLTMLEDLLVDRERRLDLLAYPAVADRVAVALLRMRDRQGGVSLTHQALGEAIGASRETVTKVLLRLRDEGLIQTRPRHIRLVDPGRLELRLQ